MLRSLQTRLKRFHPKNVQSVWTNFETLSVTRSKRRPFLGDVQSLHVITTFLPPFSRVNRSRWSGVEVHK